MKPDFGIPVRQLAAQRHSVRTYRGELLEPGLRQRLDDCLQACEGAREAEVRFCLLDSAPGQVLGTYGIIRGARHFVAAVAASGGEAELTELGYRLEKFALFASSLGLGTCWLGGTFSRGGFAKAANLRPGELLPIAMPVGYPAESPRVFERLMRVTTGARRKPWEELFFNGDLTHPLTPEAAGPYAPALETLRLAPSAMNAQPWRVVKESGRWILYEKGAPGGGFDMHLIDMGIAMRHFSLAAAEAGLAGSWHFEPATAPQGYRFVAAWQA